MKSAVLFCSVIILVLAVIASIYPVAFYIVHTRKDKSKRKEGANQ